MHRYITGCDALQLPVNRLVAGSNPARGAKRIKDLAKRYFHQPRAEIRHRCTANGSAPWLVRIMLVIRRSVPYSRQGNWPSMWRGPNPCLFGVGASSAFTPLPS